MSERPLSGTERFAKQSVLTSKQTPHNLARLILVAQFLGDFFAEPDITSQRGLVISAGTSFTNFLAFRPRLIRLF